MGDERKAGALGQMKDRSGSVLDVGCGRGEFVAELLAQGFDAWGVDPVPYLAGGRVITALGHALPFSDGAFEYVSCLDVMEHILPGDDSAVVRECWRVARRGVLLTIANYSAVWDGVELHINRRDYGAWEQLLAEWTGGRVDRRKDVDGSAVFWIWKVADAD